MSEHQKCCYEHTDHLANLVATLTAENERLRERVNTLEPIAGVAEKIGPGGGQVKIMPVEAWDDVWGRITQAEARVRALVEAIESNAFCECFDEYGRKRPKPCWRCAALTEPTPPQGERG